MFVKDRILLDNSGKDAEERSEHGGKKMSNLRAGRAKCVSLEGGLKEAHGEIHEWAESGSSPPLQDLASFKAWELFDYGTRELLNDCIAHKFAIAGRTLQQSAGEIVRLCNGVQCGGERYWRRGLDDDAGYEELWLAMKVCKSELDGPKLKTGCDDLLQAGFCWVGVEGVLRDSVRFGF